MKIQTKTVYPCCAKPCTLNWDPEQGKTALTRAHFCDRDDATGTSYQISLDRRSLGYGIQIDRVEFLDLASSEALRLYGKKTIPHRTVRS